MCILACPIGYANRKFCTVRENYSRNVRQMRTRSEFPLPSSAFDADNNEKIERVEAQPCDFNHACDASRAKGIVLDANLLRELSIRRTAILVIFCAACENIFIRPRSYKMNSATLETE